MEVEYANNTCATRRKQQQRKKKKIIEKDSVFQNLLRQLYQSTFMIILIRVI
jgi:hypothetical protein